MPASGWRAGVSSARAARCVWSSQGNHKTVSHAHRLRLCAAPALARRAAGPVARPGRGCPPGPTGQPAGVPAGQLIRMLRPSPFRDTWTSSASPAITARPSCAGSAAGSCPSEPVAGCGGHAMPSSPTAAVLVTTTSNRSSATGQRDPDRLARAVLLVHLDRPRAGLAHREPDLVEQCLRHATAPRHGCGYQPRRAHVRGQRRERHLHGGHRLGRRSVTSPTSGRRWPRPRCRGCRRPSSAR